MSRQLPSEVANVLKPYEDLGWQFAYGRSQNSAYQHTVVLTFIVPGQVPRFERFKADDVHVAKAISRTPKSAQCPRSSYE